MRKFMRIYIAGAMTGLPNYNYHVFDAKAEELRAQGHTVINPADIGRRLFGKRIDLDVDELEYLLEVELKELTGGEAIYLLDGWHNSKGARKELYHALGNGLKVILEVA
jgi:hypothetical protein